MEQIELFSDPQRTAAFLLRDAAAEVVAENELPLDKLFVRETSEYYSVVFFDSVVLQVGGKLKKYIAIQTSVLRRMHNYRQLAGSKDYTKITISAFSEAANYIELAKCAMQSILDRMPAGFDCCSRYLECSDAKSCTHPDKDFSLKCGYRKILRSGRIFYGKNRNINA